jgi:hypothetical protein
MTVFLRLLVLLVIGQSLLSSSFRNRILRSACLVSSFELGPLVGRGLVQKREVVVVLISGVCVSDAVSVDLELGFGPGLVKVFDRVFGGSRVDHILHSLFVHLSRLLLRRTDTLGVDYIHRLLLPQVVSVALGYEGVLGDVK